MKEKTNAVWITGVSSGIGKAIAIEFAKNKFFVIGSSRNLKSLQQIKRDLGKYKIYFEPRFLDIGNTNSIIRFYKSLSVKYQINCLINNAGLTSFKEAIDDSIEDIEKIVKVNLIGSVVAIKSVLPAMFERKEGTIINILSVVTKKIFTSSSAYSASKSGLMAYTNVLREEVRDKNIRVINILPGATATSIWPNKVLDKYSKKMMNAKNIAELVCKIYSEKSNLVVEDIIIRPISGDL